VKLLRRLERQLALLRRPMTVALVVFAVALAGLLAAGWALLVGGSDDLVVQNPPPEVAGVRASSEPVPAAATAGPGTPVVQLPPDPAEAAERALATCRDRGYDAKVTCYDGLLTGLVSSAGVEAAMETLKRIGEADQEVQRDGHVYSHAIGIEGYRLDPDVGRTFARCTELYQSGCYHGVIQAHFLAVTRGDGAGAITARQVNQVCDAYRGEAGNQWLLFQCVHGMGHGLTMIHRHDLRRALADCDLLTLDWDRHSCYGGAFMENIVNATQPHHGGSHLEQKAPQGDDEHGHAAGGATAKGDFMTPSGFKALDASDPLYPCSVLETRYLVDCYQMQTSVILFHNRGDIGGAARACDGAPEEWRPACYQSLGRDVSSYTLQDPDESIRMCSLGRPAYQPWCYVGLVKNFVDLTAKTDTGFAFCRKVPGRANQLKCYEALGEEISVLSADPARRGELCAEAKGEFAEACRYGARLDDRPPPGLPRAAQGA
jgi:hypothetical protein